MFEDEDFYFDEESLNADDQMSLLDEARHQLVLTMEKILNELKYNLKLGEPGYDENLSALGSQLDILIELSSDDYDELSDEEQKDIIEKALKQSTEITFNNINEIIPVERKEKVEEKYNEDDSSSLDF